jgi:hypothetical protein
MKPAECVYFVVKGELPDVMRALSRCSKTLVQNGTALEVAKFLLKAGGGPRSDESEWTLIGLEEPVADVVASLQGVIRDSVRETGECAVGVEDLPVPISSLDPIAKSTNTVVQLAVLFRPDPDSTWDD